jgi:outer membrane protein assembly factor BamB
MNGQALCRALFLPAAIVFCGFSGDWPAFRHDALRSGAQPEPSALSDPKQAMKLKVAWKFPGADYKGPKVKGFRASPVVYKGQVFIGNSNGYFYALNAKTGEMSWRYPSNGSKLLSKFPACNPSGSGIASSAVIAKIDERDVVIFAAPDPCAGEGFGDGRLFALDIETGKEISSWTSGKSDVIARVTGCTINCPDELHENLGHSSPLVLGNRVYIGVGDHCDNPVQQGRVAAIELATGRIDTGFTFCSTGQCGDGTRGGGVWSPPAGWQDGVFITTGNTRSGTRPKPCPNYGLSLLRLDAATGDLDWPLPFNAVPWEIDEDSDWSAAPTVMLASCGPIVISTQKDGWTHAVNAANGSHRWSYPRHDIPFNCADGTCHGDSRYMRSGAVWGDVYVAMNGGANLVASGVNGGYRRLHAFDVCERNPKKRLRWLIDIPGACCSPDPCKDEDGEGRCALSCNYCLGNPTLSGGIVYIGTDQGLLVVIADPAVARPTGWRCENPDIETRYCRRMKYRLVPEPQILKKIQLEGSMVYTEPALANGEVYVSTDVRDEDGISIAGYVYMLHP